MAHRMIRLYERLTAFGIDRNFVRTVALPAGWRDEEAEANPAVYSHALTLLSRNLNLDLRALQDDKAPLSWHDCGPTLFKRKQNIPEDDLTRAKCLAARAAQVACRAVTSPVTPLPDSGAEIRNAIRAKGLNWVTLEALLNYCWDCGIPVLHVSRFPLHAKKPDALAILCDGRPAIVLCKQHKFAAWLLFCLAHELGHIGLCHLNGKGLLVDQKIERDSHDAQEEEANAFAVELLTGKPDILYEARYHLTAEQLAEGARMVGKRDGVDPGVIALNYAWNKGHFAAGNATLALIEPNADAVAMIRNIMCARLDWERLTRDSRQFLR